VGGKKKKADSISRGKKKEGRGRGRSFCAFHLFDHLNTGAPRRRKKEKKKKKKRKGGTRKRKSSPSRSTLLPVNGEKKGKDPPQDRPSIAAAARHGITRVRHPHRIGGPRDKKGEKKKKKEETTRVNPGQEKKKKKRKGRRKWGQSRSRPHRISSAHRRPAASSFHPGSSGARKKNESDHST